MSNDETTNGLELQEKEKNVAVDIPSAENTAEQSNSHSTDSDATLKDATSTPTEDPSTPAGREGGDSKSDDDDLVKKDKDDEEKKEKPAVR